MGDNLKEMQAAFEEWAGYSAEFNPSAWKAWQAAIASQQAAHEAEIARLKKEMCALRTECAGYMVELIGANEQLSAANERIAHLEGLVALKDDALKDLHYALYGNGTGSTKIEAAISASAETVQAFRDKLIEPLRREVAMLHTFIENHASADNSGGEYPYECIACEERYDKHTKDCELVSVLSNTQATAEAYEREVEARGAVKALEELLTCDDMTNTGYIHKSAIARRATSKKAG